MARADRRHAHAIAATGRAMGYAFVFAGMLTMIAPFYFTFVFATHARADIFSVPPPLWFGDNLFANLRILFDTVPFWRNLGMSLYVAAMTTGLNLLLCSLGGFAFAAYEFRFKNALFAIAVASMIIPAYLNMVPSFLVMDFLGWIDQPRALYIPGAAGALGIFLMRQYIATAVPRELLDAARIDGCSEFRIYWSVVLPLIGPALGTLGLVTFITSWNNFVAPLVVMQSPENFTIPLALRSMQNPAATEWGAVMAGSAIAVLPLLVAFAFASRRLIEGLTAGAVRG
jgi:multiple sugar transport system permease protein